MKHVSEIEIEGLNCTLKELPQKRLDDLYQRVANLTKPKCASCNVPFGCCSPDIGLFVEEQLKEIGVIYPKTGNKKCQYLSDEGCATPPKHRPLCSVHVCEKHYIIDQKFAQEYFDLREEIDELEYLIRREK